MKAKISVKKGKLSVPNNPVIPYIEGDGVGPDVVKAAIKVLDKAVEKAYKGKKKIVWKEILAGKKAYKKTKNYLPPATIREIKNHVVVLKGPLETPIGGGIRSLNVALRQQLDLYACVRPVKYYKGVPSPMKNPEKLDIIIFRENTEDVYAGIEWKKGSKEAKDIISYIRKKTKKLIRKDSGIGIKPISATGSKRLVRAAINYAIKNNKRSITLMHKGNIMKFTEGAFREWGYQTAKEFKNVVKEGKKGKIMIKDRIADSMFQQILLRPEEYDIIATTNLNGDYVSDAAAAQVGGIGIAPGANINYENGTAIFEATHGTAPKYAGMDKVNPGSVILSGVMMLEYIGWKEAAKVITKGLEKTIQKKTVTYDFARQIKGAKKVKCSEFAKRIIANM